MEVGAVRRQASREAENFQGAGDGCLILLPGVAERGVGETSDPGEYEARGLSLGNQTFFQGLA